MAVGLWVCGPLLWTSGSSLARLGFGLSIFLGTGLGTSGSRLHIFLYAHVTCVYYMYNTHIHTYIHPYIYPCMHACIHTLIDRSDHR